MSGRSRPTITPFYILATTATVNLLCDGYLLSYGVAKTLWFHVINILDGRDLLISRNEQFAKIIHKQFLIQSLLLLGYKNPNPL